MSLKILWRAINKKVKLLGLLISIGTLLSGCGAKNNEPMISSESNQTNENSQRKNIALALVAGKPVEDMEAISVPVVLKNLGKNGTVINTENFYLKIDGQKIDPLDIPQEPSAYHEDFFSNEIWSSTLTFYLGTKLTQKQLKNLEIYYKLENGQTIKGKFLNADFSHASISNSKTAKNQQLGDYYSNVADYVAETKRALENKGEPTSLKERFSDSNYDQVRCWVIIYKKNPDIAILKILNHSNTPLALSYDDFELVDKDNNEVRVDPYFRSFYIDIPANKSTTVAVKLDGKIAQNDVYKVKIRGTNGDRNYIDTDKGFHEIEVLQTSIGDLAKADTLEPDNYPTSQIKWSNPELDLKNKIFKCTVTIKDYFSLTLDKDKIALAGVNKDGTSDDKENPNKITIKIITSTNPTNIEMKFDDLSILKAYPHLELRYNNKKLLRIK